MSWANQRPADGEQLRRIFLAAQVGSKNGSTR